MIPVSFRATFSQSPSFIANFDKSNDISANFDSVVSIGGLLPSDELPMMDGTADAGVARKVSRSDHVHPSDTNKMDYMSPISNIELNEMLR